MKKVVLSVVSLVIILMIFTTPIYATETNIIDTNAASELIKTKESTQDKIAEYTERYGSPTYGLAAFILNTVRIYSIPFCFIGIAVGAIYQYVIGIRRLDTQERGFNLLISFVTILVICQVLPLIFTLVVQGWRG